MTRDIGRIDALIGDEHFDFKTAAPTAGTPALTKGGKGCYSRYPDQNFDRHGNRREPSINTHYDPKPIPLRQFDWSAVRGDFDLGSLIGYGATEREAIEELLDLEGWSS